MMAELILKSSFEMNKKPHLFYQTVVKESSNFVICEVNPSSLGLIALPELAILPAQLIQCHVYMTRVCMCMYIHNAMLVLQCKTTE